MRRGHASSTHQRKAACLLPLSPRAPMRATRCLTTAVQPLRAHARSHRHLDPALRLRVLSQEYQRIWGDEALPAAQAAFRRELQAKQQPFDDYELRTAAPPDETFALRRRLALCGFHRSLIRMPKLYWVAQPGTENPATMFARLPGDRQSRQFMLVFSSMLQYQSFASHAAMPNHSVEEADGDALGGVIQPLKAIARMHLVLDPSPNFSSHRGLISGDEFLSFNLQQSSLHLSEHLKSGRLPERDTFLESHVFSYFTTASGVPHMSASDVTGRVLPVFVSDVHFDVMRHSLGASFVAKQQRYSKLLDTIRAMPQVQGIVLDSLPPTATWTSVASDELLRDTCYAYLADRKA